MKISVAMCTYNGEKFLEEQINSIIHQTNKPDEIILCDDKSTDETINIAKSLLENCGISYIIMINPTNLGVVRNFEKCIGLTTGDIIFLSDQDDIWAYNKIELIMEKFRNDSSCIMVFSDADIVDEKRNKKGARLWETLNFSISEFNDKDFIEILLNRCVVTGATMAIRRKLYEKTLPFQNSWIHDGWLAINSPIFGKVMAIEKPMIEYRQHGNNVIGALKINSFGRLKKYFKNIKILVRERKLRVDRYKVFYNFQQKEFNENSKDEIANCINFWLELEKLSSIKISKGLSIIIRNLFNRNYKKYYTGFRGAMRDVIYLFVRRRY